MDQNFDSGPRFWAMTQNGPKQPKNLKPKSSFILCAITREAKSFFPDEFINFFWYQSASPYAKKGKTF